MLVDCGNDDPSCEDYHGIGNAVGNNIEVRADEENIERLEVYSIQIYTITGDLIYQGMPLLISEIIQQMPGQLIVIVFLDKEGKLLNTQKYLQL